MGKASTKAQNRYIAKAYDRINLTVPKGQKDVIQTHATTHGESVNGFIGRAIGETMERDGSACPQKGTEGTLEAGAVSLPAETEKAAQRAAEVTGETVADFITRAVDTQAQRDKASLRIGINPATKEKLGKESGTDQS